MNFTLNKSNATSLKLLFFAFLLFSIKSYSQDIALNEKPAITSTDEFGVLSFETDVIDFGKVAQNSDGVRTFKFTNTGTKPIAISKVKTSCGCTVPKYSKEPILVGESGEIEIKYDTKRVGNFTKTITVMSNASEANKVIKIKGEVIKPV